MLTHSHFERVKLSVEGKCQGIFDELQALAVAGVDYWREVPYLALKADGRSGFSELYSWAYRYGLWTMFSITSHNRGGHVLFIDCATGRLVRWDGGKPHTDDLLQLALHVDELDALGVVQDLEKKSRKKIASYSSKTAAELRKWRRKQANTWSVTPMYERLNGFPSF